MRMTSQLPVSNQMTSRDVIMPLAAPGDAEFDIEVLRTLPQRFCIVDEQSATWLVRRISEARRYGIKVKEWAEHEGRRAEREEQTLLRLFGSQIEAWVRSEVEKLNGRRKSISLPAGTVGFRTNSACLQIDDEHAVLNWAKKNCPGAVLVVEKLSRSILKDYFEKTGDIPNDGAHVEPAAEKFYIR